MKELTFRDSIYEDSSFLKKWLMDPDILRWFPMCNKREVDDSVQYWMGNIKQKSVFTALYNEIPCANAILYIQPYKKFSHQCLFAIIVGPEYRNRGIGSNFMHYLFKMAKERFNLEILHLEVYEGNPAINLYQRLGFKQYGFQKNFLKENGHYLGKILMQKQL